MSTRLRGRCAFNETAKQLQPGDPALKLLDDRGQRLIRERNFPPGLQKVDRLGFSQGASLQREHLHRAPFTFTGGEPEGSCVRLVRTV